jgi:hypothetical protein
MLLVFRDLLTSDARNHIFIFFISLFRTEQATFYSSFCTPHLTDLFKGVDIPFGVWFGRDNAFPSRDTFIEQVRNASKAPFKEIAVVESELIRESAASWVKRLAAIVSPSQNFRLENITLDDFEQLELIGRGAFFISSSVFAKALVSNSGRFFFLLSRCYGESVLGATQELESVPCHEGALQASSDPK